jgi:hypothetical protein
MGGEFLDRVVRSHAFTHQLRSKRAGARHYIGDRAERYVGTGATLAGAYTDGPTGANLDRYRYAGAHRNASAVAHQQPDHAAHPHSFANDRVD